MLPSNQETLSKPSVLHADEDAAPTCKLPKLAFEDDPLLSSLDLLSENSSTPPSNQATLVRQSVLHAHDKDAPTYKLPELAFEDDTLVGLRSEIPSKKRKRKELSDYPKGKKRRLDQARMTQTTSPLVSNSTTQECSEVGTSLAASNIQCSENLAVKEPAQSVSHDRNPSLESTKEDEKLIAELYSAVEESLMERYFVFPLK